jgi:hypothetical protein
MPRPRFVPQRRNVCPSVRTTHQQPPTMLRNHDGPKTSELVVCSPGHGHSPRTTRRTQRLRACSAQALAGGASSMSGGSTGSARMLSTSAGGGRVEHEWWVDRKCAHNEHKTLLSAVVSQGTEARDALSAPLRSPPSLAASCSCSPSTNTPLQPFVAFLLTYFF